MNELERSIDIYKTISERFFLNCETSSYSETF